MLSTYPAYSIENIGQMTARQYESLLVQAVNIKNWQAGEKLELLTTKEKQRAAENEYKELKKSEWKKR